MSASSSPPRRSEDSVSRDGAPAEEAPPAATAADTPSFPTTYWTEELLGLLFVLGGLFFGVPLLFTVLKYVFFALLFPVLNYVFFALWSVLGWVGWLFRVTGLWWLDLGFGVWGLVRGVGVWR